MDDRERARGRARRAALAVTLALGMGGCYMDHRMVDETDAGREEDSGIARADAGHDAGWDSGVDHGCTPDPDCNGPFDHPAADGVCDWDQHNACCTARGWDIEACWLPGGPLSPPEMPA